MKGEPAETDGRGARCLAEHVANCPHCRTEAVDPARVAGLLDPLPAGLKVTLLSQQTLAALRPELARRSLIRWRRRVAVSVLWAMLPLPLILVYDAYVLRTAYELLQAVLPSGVALYVLATYTSVLSLLFALTYAAIPILLARSAGSGDAAAP